MSTSGTYYIPHKATWPVMATAGLVTMLAGFANYLNGSSVGSIMMIMGLVIFIVMLAGWFTLQSGESESGMYSTQVGISYRMGMMWFIFSEVMFLLFSLERFGTQETYLSPGWVAKARVRQRKSCFGHLLKHTGRQMGLGI